MALKWFNLLLGEELKVLNDYKKTPTQPQNYFKKTGGSEFCFVASLVHVSVEIKKLLIPSTSDFEEYQLFPFLSTCLHCRFRSSEVFPKEISVSALEKFPNYCCTR